MLRWNNLDRMDDHVKDRIESYLAGFLTGDALRKFESHLTECRGCADAVEESQDARSCLQLLVADEPPPQPGPDFYFKVQSSIDRKLDSGWFGNLTAVLQVPRLAFPLLFLLLGLLLTAWTFTQSEEPTELSVLGIPQLQFADATASDADRVEDLDLVMTSLVEDPEVE